MTMNSDQPLNIIIDTDPGIDDAIALLLALASPELNILGVTTVAGNIPQNGTFANAHKILSLANARIPVYRGAEQPLVRELVTAESVNGDLGLGFYEEEIDYPKSSSVHAVDFIIEHCRKHFDAPLILCTLGPLTNLALALEKAPEISQGVDKIVMMGGALTVRGNVTCQAEFNIYVDPHAADVVFRSGIPIVMHPLDVTNQTNAPVRWIDSFQSNSSHFSQAVYQMLSFCKNTDARKMHDVCVSAWLIRPDLFDFRPCYVRVDVEDKGQTGKTFASFDQTNQHNVLAAFGVDSQGFYKLLSERLALLDS